MYVYTVHCTRHTVHTHAHIRKNLETFTVSAVLLVCAADVDGDDDIPHLN